MRPFGRRLRWLRAIGVIVLVLSANVWTACGGAQQPAAEAPKARALNCGVDEVREYLCDDFLPLANALPAPMPYDSCPSSVDDPASEYEPAPSLGVFDAGYTEYTRKRAPPGHACCYSWCSKVELADPSAPSAQSACRTASAFREEFCMPEPEAGTRLSMGGSFEKCPAAIAPPAKSVFSAPKVALFDGRLTQSHRGKGEVECCYAWCSQAPPGSGILK